MQAKVRINWNAKQQLRTLVHGDDFVTVGARSSVRWFNEKLRRRFAIKTCVIGPAGRDSSGVRAGATGEVQEGKVLNRLVRCTEAGYELEADPRHAEMIVEALDLTCESHPCFRLFFPGYVRAYNLSHVLYRMVRDFSLRQQSSFLYDQHIIGTGCYDNWIMFSQLASM